MKRIDELVAEMREVSGDETVNEIVITKRDWLTMADRIDAACKTLEKAYNNAVSADARHCLENAKLRRALEPVMECELLSQNYDECDFITEENAGSGDYWRISEMVEAVREAQAIMKEGAE